MKRSEHAPDWRKSSHSGGNSGDCLEVDAAHPTAVPVRDSKRLTGPSVAFDPGAWASFTTAVRAGDLS